MTGLGKYLDALTTRGRKAWFFAGVTIFALGAVGVAVTPWSWPLFIIGGLLLLHAGFRVWGDCQAQLEQVRDARGQPKLILEFPEQNLKKARRDSDWIELRNVGATPAHGVRIAPIERGPYRAVFAEVQIVDTTKPEALKPQTTKDGQISPVFSGLDFFRDMLAWGAQDFNTVANVELVITYTNNWQEQKQTSQHIGFNQTTSVISVSDTRRPLTHSVRR